MNMNKETDHPEHGFDPRPVSDEQLREEFTQEQVERWRKEADEAHCKWFDVIDNQYGKD